MMMFVCRKCERNKTDNIDTFYLTFSFVTAFGEKVFFCQKYYDRLIYLGMVKFKNLRVLLVKFTKSWKTLAEECRL